MVRNFSLDNINQNENKITFDLSELNNGIYFCEIKSNTTALKYKMIKIQ
ncbi:MAG: T9SS type A sorting domain-containing protein [Bacteroidetes bacterium]|nr:T9SS type A sorting domain-containing protein [Bacteroidota bacterium]